MIYFLINENGTCGGTIGVEPTHKRWTTVPYLGSLVKEYFNGSEWVEQATPEEMKARVPEAVKNVQLRLALIKSGKSVIEITQAIYALPQSQRKEELLTLWEYRETMHRNDESLNQMAEHLGFTQADLDNLFILADTL